MKKIILSVAAMLTFGLANAQEVEFGVKGGINIANIVSKDDSADSKVGFHVGAFAEIKISDKFSIQPELLFSTQGATAKETVYVEGAFYNGEVKFNLSYINVPVMAKFYVAKGFSLEAGPQIGFLTSAKGDVEVSQVGGGPVIKQTQDIKEMFNTVDFGLNFGLGYKFTEKFSAGARYNLGLSDLNKEGDSDQNSIKNSVIQISVGYAF